MIIGTRPLCDWVIVLAGMRNFIGKPTKDSLCEFALAPVYELRTIVDPRVGIVRQIVPVLMYPIDRLDVKNATGKIALNELPIAEVEILQKAVEECDRAMVHLRAHQTGVVTATELPQTPLITMT